MAVKLLPPTPEQLRPVPGLELGVAMAGVRKPGRKDLLLMRLAEGERVMSCFPIADDDDSGDETPTGDAPGETPGEAADSHD